MSAMDPLVPDRPLRLAEMVTATYRYMRRNPAATLGIGALLGTVTSVVSGIVIDGIVFGSNRGGDLQRVLAGETLTTEQLEAAIAQISAIAPYLAMAGAVATLVQFAAMGVMTLGMVRAMHGEHVQPSTLWRVVPWGRIIGINLAMSVLMLLLISVPVGIAFVAGGPAAIAAVAVAGLLAFVVAVLSTLAVPAAIIDGLGVKDAIRRAVAVTRSGLLRASWLIFASLVFWDALGSIIAAPIGSLFGALAGGASSASGHALDNLVAGIVSGAITLPATSAMAVLVYIDCVRRSSGQ